MLAAVSRGERYDALTARDAVTAVSTLRSVDDVQIVLAYEQAHTSRQDIVEAANTQVSSLAKDSVNSWSAPPPEAGHACRARPLACERRRTRTIFSLVRGLQRTTSVPMNGS